MTLANIASLLLDHSGGILVEQMSSRRWTAADGGGLNDSGISEDAGTIARPVGRCKFPTKIDPFVSRKLTHLKLIILYLNFLF
jgi:hypothetical protein